MLLENKVFSDSESSKELGLGVIRSLSPSSERKIGGGNMSAVADEKVERSVSDGTMGGMIPKTTKREYLEDLRDCLKEELEERLGEFEIKESEIGHDAVFFTLIYKERAFSYEDVEEIETIAAEYDVIAFYEVEADNDNLLVYVWFKVEGDE
jgi:hypothetical protein